MTALSPDATCRAGPKAVSCHRSPYYICPARSAGVASRHKSGLGNVADARPCRMDAYNFPPQTRTNDMAKGSSQKKPLVDPNEGFS
jgi:hypothetical protein